MIELPSHFWSKVDKSGPNGCWIWTATINPAGYGRFGNKTKTLPTDRAHRLAYLALVGEIPEDMELDHYCSTPACIRPDHLEPVTHKENIERGRIYFRIRAVAITHCPQGHEYKGRNVILHEGKRHCRACMNKTTSKISNRKRSLKRKARREAELLAYVQSHVA